MNTFAFIYWIVCFPWILSLELTSLSLHRDLPGNRNKCPLTIAHFVNMGNTLLDVFSTKSEREFTKGTVWIEFAKGFKLFRKGQGNRVSNCLPRFKLPEVDEERYIISMPGWNPQWTGRVRGTLEEGRNFSASAAEIDVERVARYQELSESELLGYADFQRFKAFTDQKI